MSPAAKERWIAIAMSAAASAIPLLVAIGIAWASLGAQVSGKLNTDRFLVDSISTHGGLDDVKASLDRLNTTWTKLYCRDHPHDSVCP